MKAYLLFLAARLLPLLWLNALMLSLMSVAFYLFGLGRGMTGRRDADDFALWWALAFLVAAVPLYVYRDAVPPE